MALAAGWDIRWYRIPNWLTAGVLVAFAVKLFALKLSGAPDLSSDLRLSLDWLWHLGAGLAVFIACAILFYARLIGGGDAKLIAAVAVWTGFAGLPRFLLVTSLVGGLLGFVYIVIFKILAARDSGMPDDKIAAHKVPLRKMHVPYGVAIAAAGLDYLWHGSDFLAHLVGR